MKLEEFGSPDEFFWFFEQGVTPIRFVVTEIAHLLTDEFGCYFTEEMLAQNVLWGSSL